MKALLRMLSLLIVFGVWSAAATSITGTLKTVTLDGSTNEWTAADVMYPDDQITDGAPDTTTYYTVSLCNDANNIYVMLNTKGSGGADINNACTRSLYVDDDGNAATGFNAGWMSRGYDRLVQYGTGGGAYSVYRFTGANQSDWAWQFLGTISYSYSDSIIEWGLPRALIQTQSVSTLYMEFSVSGGDVTTETWAYQWENGVGTYTVIPEPAAAGLLAALGVYALRRRRG